jgi:hypothetical protein
LYSTNNQSQSGVPEREGLNVSVPYPPDFNKLKNKVMETVKFVCEFFFTNFWHWLGLTITLGVFRFGTVIIDKSDQIISKNNKEE